MSRIKNSAAQLLRLSWTGGISWNAQRTLAFRTPLAAFVGEAGAAGRIAAVSPTATITVLWYIDKIEAIAAIGEHRTHASRITCDHGRD